MALAAFLKAGAIKGTGVQQGRAGEMPITSFSHKVTRVIDPYRAAVGTMRAHSLFMIQKNIDISTPPLHQAHQGRVVLSPWVLRLFHMPKSGPEAHYFTIVLVGARIEQIKTIFPPLLDPANAIVHEHEQVFFSYDSITFKEEKVTPPGGGTLQPGTARMTHKMGGETVFGPDWPVAAAKEEMKGIIKQIQTSGGSWGTKMYDTFVAKLLGKKPPSEPPPPTYKPPVDLE